MAYLSYSNQSYLKGLLDTFLEEVVKSAKRAREVIGLKAPTQTLLGQVAKADFAKNPSLFLELYQRYVKLNYQKASFLNNAGTLARSYSSMDDLWHDAAQQKEGKSPYTFWDTYEHGRRRQLEKLLANVYGSEDALLLNSGMSAVFAGIEVNSLSKGDILLTTDKNYFETTDYLSQIIEKRGIRVIRCPSNQITSYLKEYKPKLLIVETVANTPESPVIESWLEWENASSNTFILIDNTLQSHLTRWFSSPFSLRENVAVIESATKYLSQDCVAGVLYGYQDLVNKARILARNTGQHLQEKAFNYLAEGQIQLVIERLKLHSRNTLLFCRILKEDFGNYFEYIRECSHADRESPVFTEGIGGLVFLNPVCLSTYSKQELNRKILHRWQEKCQNKELNLPVRAGFGWTQTIARIYESSYLNQPDSPCYIRVAVGIEPESIIFSLANLLGQAVQECFNYN